MPLTTILIREGPKGKMGNPNKLDHPETSRGRFLIPQVTSE